jgi:Arabinose-binding domain of AraC transcription regulator, N-term
MEFAARAGLSSDRLQSPTGMMPLATFASMLEAAALETGNGTLGLDLGKEFQLSLLAVMFGSAKRRPALNTTSPSTSRLAPERRDAAQNPSEETI